MQEEEAGQPERGDHPQLLLQARARRGAVRVAGRIALLEALRAQLGQRAVGLRVLRARVAVAEVLREVEGQPVGQRARLGDRARVVLEARRHRRRGGEHVGEVAAAHRLRGIERGVVAQGDEGVLQRRPRARVRVDVARGHGRHAEAAGQLGEAAVARAVVAVEGALELDPQVVGAEDACSSRRSPGSSWTPWRAQPLRQTSPAACCSSVASGTTGGGSLLSRSCSCAAVTIRQRLRQPVASSTSSVTWRPSSSAISAPWIARSPRLAADCANSIEPHRPVVVGERERVVAELDRRPHQLVRERGPVEEGEGGVGMELDVHERMFAYVSDSVAPRC